MDNTARKLIEAAIHERDVSIRQAAREMGISHATLIRVIQGYVYSADTAMKIANWLNVPPATLIDTGGGGVDSLAAQISLALREEPELVPIFTEAMKRIAEGQMSPATLRELMAWVAFRMNIQASTTQQETDGEQIAKSN